jgi:hypothetical protein
MPGSLSWVEQGTENPESYPVSVSGLPGRGGQHINYQVVTEMWIRDTVPTLSRKFVCFYYEW